MLNRVHIIGGKNQGKTTLVVDLVREYREQGIRVGTIKHTHHEHELDTPGKDSHRHRVAGASVVGIVTRSAKAAFWDFVPEDLPSENDTTVDHERYDAFVPIFADCDIVLVEGHVQTSAPKIEVWRSVLGKTPIADSEESVVAIVTDDEITTQSAVWSRTDVSAIATRLLDLAGQ